MADLEEAIYSILSNDATVSGLVSARIYPMLVPQEQSLPAIAYQEISAPDRFYAHDGPVGIARKRIQITAVAERYASLKDTLAAIRGALSGYSDTVATVKIFSSFLANEFDGYGDQNDLFVGRQDYLIMFAES